MTDSGALTKRLHNLRFVYGLSTEIVMNTLQLNGLWQLCRLSVDREQLMVFIAHASTITPYQNVSHAPVPPGQAQLAQPDNSLSAAFTEDVAYTAFLDLFCSREMDFDSLGEDAYSSFQLMFGKHVHSGN